VPSLYQNCIYPLYRIKSGAFGFQVIKAFKTLDRTQWKTKRELASYRDRKLQSLIRHVFENVPYYTEIMRQLKLKPEDIKNADDLQLLPVLTKRTIRENYDKLLSKNIDHKKTFVGSTGGSTGEPLKITRDRQTQMYAEAAFLRGMSWSNYRIGDTVVDFRSLGKQSFLGRARRRLINSYDFEALAKEEDLIRIMKRVKSLRPFCLIGYASNIFRIASICQKNEIDSGTIPVIFSTGETLFEYQREMIQNVFNGRVYDYYGCNEIGSIAYECEYQHKHLTEEHIILETTDTNGSRVCDNLGQFNITDLDNYAMPFIRYQNGDVGVIGHESCECGRGLKVLRSLEGRVQEFLTTQDGNCIPAIFFPGRFRNLRGMSQYQIIQTSVQHIILKVVKNPSFRQSELDEMVSVIKETLGAGVEVSLEQHDYIPLTARGKNRLVISQLPARFT
jgi:phenylacetate-CoA ligase